MKCIMVVVSCPDKDVRFKYKDPFLQLESADIYTCNTI